MFRFKTVLYNLCSKGNMISMQITPSIVVECVSRAEWGIGEVMGVGMAKIKMYPHMESMESEPLNTLAAK